MKNERRTSKNGWKSSRNHPRKRYGSASAWIFFTETIFFLNFKWFSNYQEGWTFFPFTSPPIYRKMGEKLATQLAQASSVASSRSNRLLEEFSGRPKWAWLLFAPPFLLSTPPALFWWFFFRNVTKLYEIRNDACFLSVMLRNLMDYVIIHFLPFGTLQNFTDCALTLPLFFGMSRNFTDCATILSFDFWHITKLHELPNDGCQVPRSGQMRVAS